MFDHLIGIPFKEEGRTKEGYDCWGLARVALRTLNINVPEFQVDALDYEGISEAISLASMSKKWRRVETPKVGCVVVIKNHPRFVNHIGVYVGNGMFIHTLRGTSSCLERITNPMWSKRIKGFWEYVG